MTPGGTNVDLFLQINRFAERTAWLHGPMEWVANYGIIGFSDALRALVTDQQPDRQG